MIRLLALAFCALFALPAAAQQPHNIIIFVADGLRYGSATPADMPNFARLKAEGVDFTNSHALYPTVTTANASAIATGHYIGDTGDFGNTLYDGGPMLSLKGASIGFLENDLVLEEMNQRFGGNYLGETSLIARARAAGWQTAVIGKEGPSRIQDLTANFDGSGTIILDDATGHDGGIGLPQWFTGAIRQAFVGPSAPAVAAPDIEQELYLMKAATRVVLPHFQQNAKPFILLFWSRDPDYSQHYGRDSIGEYDPGINGPSGLAGTRNADTMLGELLAALKASGLDKTTDVFVTADHGFTTISRASATSPAAHFADPNVPLSDLPYGFVSIDLAAGLGLPLYDAGPGREAVDFSNGAKPASGSGLLGADPAHPDIVVASNGGSDLIYLPGPDAREMAGSIVNFLSGQDYVSGLFVNDALGKIPGALPLSAVGLMGAARTPVPAIFVNFRSFSGNCSDPLQCTVEVADTPLAVGQGNHGSLSRAETRNFMAALGPDFKTGFADPAPVSNADIAPTLARLMGLDLASKGKLKGRVIAEAVTGGTLPVVARRVVASDPGPEGVRTYLDEQSVGDTRYFDAAGFEGKTVGLSVH